MLVFKEARSPRMAYQFSDVSHKAIDQHFLNVTSLMNEIHTKRKVVNQKCHFDNPMVVTKKFSKLSALATKKVVSKTCICTVTTIKLSRATTL